MIRKKVEKSVKYQRFSLKQRESGYYLSLLQYRVCLLFGLKGSLSVNR
jgi:hypothetical protein